MSQGWRGVGGINFLYYLPEFTAMDFVVNGVEVRVSGICLLVYLL